MPDASHEMMTSQRGDPWAGRYDGPTIALHWIVAFLVIALFALARIWDLLPHGDLRKTLEGLHISLGCLLVVAVIARILWRITGARRLGHPGLAGKMAAAGHGLLYLLMILMVITGPLKRWAAGHALNFFWLFAIPSPLAAHPGWRPLIGFLHDKGAWAIIIIAGLHAAVALFHHYALKDGVLRRMMPGR